jgi:hypothetical protein
LHIFLTQGQNGKAAKIVVNTDYVHFYKTLPADGDDKPERTLVSFAKDDYQVVNETLPQIVEQLKKAQGK